MKEKIKAILILAHGSPSAPDDIHDYLLDMRNGREPSEQLAREVRRRYELTGGSPMTTLTLAQAAALETEFSRRGRALPVYVGMLHWRPSIADAIGRMVSENVREAAVLIMAPHAPPCIEQRYLYKLDDARARAGAPVRFRTVKYWWHRPEFAEAWSERIKEARDTFSDPRGPEHTLFVAHSIPSAIADTYEPDVGSSAEHVARNVQGDWSVCFLGEPHGDDMPDHGEWLSPRLEHAIDRLAEEQIKRVLVVPVGFVCDNMEVIYEIDLEAKKLAQTKGMELVRAPSLNTLPVFISGLAAAVQDSMDHVNNGLSVL